MCFDVSGVRLVTCVVTFWVLCVCALHSAAHAWI